SDRVERLPGRGPRSWRSRSIPLRRFRRAGEHRGGGEERFPRSREGKALRNLVSESYVTIVKLSDLGSERVPAESAGVIASVERPGLSVFADEMRPWNATLLVPLWPAKLSLPAGTVLLRPPTRRAKLKVTVACSLSENEKVVPIGAFA